MSERTPNLVLASTSPRRRELLSEAGFAFRVVPPEVDEKEQAGELPDAMAQRIAREKTAAVASRLARVDAEPTVVLGADTLVVIDDSVLGKPCDAREAEQMLLRLAGRTHVVLTGFALIASDGARIEAVESSRVRLRAVSADEARTYAASGEPLDKAGGYAAQGDGGRFVESIDGSRSNVIGLPLEAVVPELARLGIRPK